MGVKYPVHVPMTCHTWLAHAMPYVRKAMEEAWYKHGEPTKNPERGALNLCEEAGEVAKAALDATRPANISHRSILVGHMIDELWQVAGYAILLAVQLEGKQGATDSGQQQP